MTFRSMKVQAFVVLCLGCLLGALAAAGKTWSPSPVLAQTDQGGEPKKKKKQPEETKPPLGGGLVLPVPARPFGGIINRNASESTPDFPKEVAPPKGAPNILVILTDDVGFGATSTFGGPVPTPAFDRLAKNGLRYNQFHTTALCSPTRAALLTGRNHHTCATGVIMELGTGYPGYSSLMPRSCGTIAEILRWMGYNTAWFGKNHNIPDWHTSAAGPFHLWPTGLGFNYFYGFLGGDCNQFAPAAYEGTQPIEPHLGKKDYHFDKDMADKAILWMRSQKSLAPDKPFFAYYAPGTAHAPHHAPKEWIKKFEGKFDQGWDKIREETLAQQIKLGVVPPGTKLAPGHKDIPAWASLNADQKKVYTRMMEVYAASLAHCDHHIGRVIDSLEEMGELDNTLIIYIQGDNGPSGEGSMQGTTNEIGTAVNGVPEDLAYLVSMIDKLGGPLSYGHYPVGWAQAMATPFQWIKQVASHFGGTRNGMVISWPKRIKDVGTIRRQFHHVIDVAPTILEAVGLEAPLVLNGIPQRPIEGVSMGYSFADPKAAGKHKTQYFEMFANRALYHEGWIASTTPKRPPWNTIGGSSKNPADDYEWELYHVDKDFSQTINIVKENPKKLRELQDLWWAEAAKYNVLPLDDSAAERVDPVIRPSLTHGRTKFQYYPGMIRITEGTAPVTRNRSFNLTADVEIPEGKVEGVLATMGGRFGGWGLMVMDGKPRFDYAFSNQEKHRWRIASDAKLTPGKHTILFEFKYDGGGLGKGALGVLSVDGKKVAEGRIERTIVFRYSFDETFDVGEDCGTPVAEDYADRMPFHFSGTLKKLTVELK
jgi:arylsulfatase A-like enzyme